MTFQRKFFCLRMACTTRQSPPPPFLSLNKKQGRRSTRRGGTAKGLGGRHSLSPSPARSRRNGSKRNGSLVFMIHPFSSKCNHSFQRLNGIPLRNFQPPGRTDRSKAARAPPGARAAHTRIKSGSEPPSAAAAAVISTAAAVPAAAGIPAAPAVSTAAAEDDNQHNDPQAASATPAIIAAPHIEVPPEI